ncbi:MAG: N-acetyltransferase [Clostridium sp.]|nr:N-acetyltransferase [Clostridium sp.]
MKVRGETEADYRAVEELTRKAFWNINGPGCDEHYLAHVLRHHEDFIPELDFVAVTPGGKVVGNVMYTKSKLVDEKGEEFPVLTFGPISVEPEYQRQGIGKKLLERSFQKAAAMGYKAIVIYGNPDNYVSRGFKSCAKYNVRSGQGTFPAAMLVKELVAGTLDGRKWVYHESPAYEIEREDAEKFEEQFEPMEKGYRACQEEFYIHSHSVILVGGEPDSNK